MKKKADIIPENITLFRLKVVESKIQSEETAQKKLNYKINVAHTVMHNLAEDRIKIGLIIELIGEEETRETNTKAHFNIDFHYCIKELISFYNLDNNKNPIFEGILIATLLGIAFSTARGLIYERLSNTAMSGIILPIVSPQKMLVPIPNLEPPKAKNK
jgi:hypothetical protein